MTAVGHTQGRAAPVPVVIIPPHFLDAKNTFLIREEGLLRSETPVPMYNNNPPADVST